MLNSQAKNRVYNLNNVNLESIHFNTPSKNKNGIYEAKLTSNILFKLPELQIQATGKNEEGNYEIWYILDLKNIKCEHLINLLESLDSKVLKIVSENCLNWFNKELSLDTIKNLYQPCYSEEDNEIVMKLEIHDKTLLNKFSKKHITLCCIDSLKFYANKFMFSFNVNDIKEIKIIEEESINLIESLDKKDPINKILKKESKKVINDNVIDDLADIETISNLSNILNYNDNDNDNDNNSKEILNKKEIEMETNLSNILDEKENNAKEISNKKEIEIETNIIESECIEKYTQHIHDSKNRQEDLDNLRLIIKQQRKEARASFVNAESASKNAEGLRKMAILKAGELKKYEDKYEELSQSSKMY